jgi:hypothetical protein
LNGERSKYGDLRSLTRQRSSPTGALIWVVFDWDVEGYNGLLSDPDMPAIFQEAGLQGEPETAEFVREHDA